MKKKYFTFLIIFMVIVQMTYAQSDYKNDKYGFSAQVPEGWSVYGNLKDDAANGRAIIDWGMPKVYSELEKANIENAVAITAYKREEIKNQEDLVSFHFYQISPILDSKKIISENPYHTYEVNTIRNGLKYKSQTMFVYQNGIGYVINFTATPGTYDINAPKFESFVKNIKLYKAIEPEKLHYDISKINTNGLYIAKTKVIKSGEIEIYTYLRFYDDGTVYAQAVNSYAPQNVSRWFGKKGRFEKNGYFSNKDTQIEFTVNNSESPDIRLEGPLSNSFEGKIIDKNNLKLSIQYNNNTEKETFDFVFVPDVEEFSIYFGNIDRKIYIPGKWEEHQKMKGGQVFIINKDKTTVGTVIYRSNQLPGYKKGMSKNEIAKLYFEWDSQYFESELNYKVEIIQEDKENGSIVWMAKKDDLESYFLFGCDGEYIYNFTIDDMNLSKETKSEFLKEIYMENKK
ncbi:hypothetical protein [Aureivirga sp. CE67]|uniref:hypothetical protein n=1 Tax=Aureivirga sp. CE67 TaxID=1788983 RepID=UPI0018CAFED7|nr:hypothetical protein [Aureivirga sp. CE67]